MAEPLKCRLRLHAWEDRENPETHAHYQVCDATPTATQVAPGPTARRLEVSPSGPVRSNGELDRVSQSGRAVATRSSARF